MDQASPEKYDKILLTVVFLLITLGLVMIASAGVIYAQVRFQDQYHFFRHQLLFGILPGLVVFYFFQKIKYQSLRKYAVPLFFASIVLLILVFIPGIGINIYGANRWIQLGSFSFQPSEMAKFSLILYMALWLEKRGQKGTEDFLEGSLPFLVIVGIVGFLIIKQPDLGTFGIIILTAFSIYFISGSKIKHLLGIGIAGILGLFLLIRFEPYRLSRLKAFLNPETDPMGIGYHINQALIAIGSGGIFGIGLGHSRQKFNYLPEPAGDSIFAIIGEELGLVGAVVVVSLFLILAIRGFKIAKAAPDKFGKLVAVGVTSWIVFQACINISAITGIVPLTGVPLPFISYGGTSIIFLMAGVGILASISKQTNLIK